MTDRLLNDEETLLASDQYDSSIGEPILQAQDIKTLKAVGEWGDTFCVEYNHYGSDKGANTRKRECRKCWQELNKGVLND